MVQSCLLLRGGEENQPEGTYLPTRGGLINPMLTLLAIICKIPETTCKILKTICQFWKTFAENQTLSAKFWKPGAKYYKPFAKYQKPFAKEVVCRNLFSSKKKMQKTFAESC